jgi:hypothetical protein
MGRKGMPSWWTSIPPPSPEEEATSGKYKKGSARNLLEALCLQMCSTHHAHCNGSMGTRIENLFVSAHVSINNPFFETFATCLLMAKLHFPRQC